ncbi:hypothetical protein [Helicobacter vulpis]|uniref:hypothetical protein n=1 Tax=Helicobacter vulpis TaxID=2316076 RepID=UPI000EAEC682|nr:hypothetical protein [Helicobacter vulpis]
MESYHADFAELYAISVLFLVGNVAHLLSDLPVKILVLSGGLRFSSALFTNLEAVERYDEERSEIAQFLCDDHVRIEFEKYKLDGRDLDRIDEISQNMSEHSVKNKFDNILCNIDWKNILTNKLSPHGIQIPEIIEQVSDTDLLIAGSIGSILREKSEANFENILTPKVLQESIKIIKRITEISTRKYLAIHALHKNIFFKRSCAPKCSFKA